MAQKEASTLLESNLQSAHPELSDLQQESLFRIESSEFTKCLLHNWKPSNITVSEGELKCDPVWDNIFCWPETPAGTVVSKLCSEVFALTETEYASSLSGNASRVCLKNGTWSDGLRTNYDECAASFEAYESNKLAEQEIVYIVQHIIFVGSILSLACLITSLVIFQQFRFLRCDRVALLVQLMIALALRFVVLIIITEPFVLGRKTSYRDVDMLCKMVILLYLYATISSVSWMFVKGLFLNTKLTSAVFNDNSREHFGIYYCVGWASPAVLLGIYIIAMVLRQENGAEKCWKGYADMNEIWILMGPMLLALLINAFFLINILRILVGQIGRRTNPNAESSPITAAAKATLVLSPVLGINNLLLLYNPGGEYEKYYVILNTLFGSTQGIFVSMVYCFFNKEVHDAIRRVYQRKKTQRRCIVTLPVQTSMRTTTRNQNIGNGTDMNAAQETFI